MAVGTAGSSSTSRALATIRKDLQLADRIRASYPDLKEIENYRSVLKDIEALQIDNRSPKTSQNALKPARELAKFAVAMPTGMRHSEILPIKWDDIDVAVRRIHIGKAKTGKRELAIPQALADMLTKERAQRDDHVNQAVASRGAAFPDTATPALLMDHDGQQRGAA